MHLRYRVAAVIAGAGLLAGSAYAVVTSDAFVRRMTRTLLARIVRGPSRVRSASFSFLDGLVVRGLEIRDPSDPVGPPAAVVDVLRADYALHLFGDGPRITSLVLERPQVRLRRMPDGTLSVAHLLAARDEAREEPGAALDVPPLRVVDGVLEYVDPAMVAGGAVRLTSVTATGAPLGDAMTVEFAGTNEELGEISGRVFVPRDGTVTGHVDLGGIPLEPAHLRRLNLPGMADAAALVRGGRVRASVAVAFAPGKDAVVGVELGLAGLETAVVLPEAHAGEPPPEPIAIRFDRGVATLDGDAIVLRDLRATLLGGTVVCERATLRSLGGGAVVSGRLDAEGFVVGPALAAHLPWAGRRVVEAYGLAGTISGRVAVDGPLASPALDVEAMLADGRVKYEGYEQEDGRRRGFPWEVTGVTGAVRFVGGTRVEFDADGRHGPARVRASGRLEYATGDEIPAVEIVAEDVPLDADLRAAFQDRAERVYDRWGPSGVAKSIRVQVLRDPHVEGPTGDVAPITIELDGRAGIRPHVLPLPFEGATGTVRILYPSLGDRRMERVAIDVAARAAAGVDLRVTGHVDTDGDVTREDLVVDARIADVGGAVTQAVHASTEFIPAGVKRFLADSGASGPADVRAEIAGDPDRRRDVVTVDLRGAAFTGYRDVPFAVSNVTGRAVVDGDEVRLSEIRAGALGSAIAGAGRLTGISGGAVEPELRITAGDLPLGEPLRRALGPIAAKASAFWDHLRPVDDGDARARDGTHADVLLDLRPSTAARPVQLWLSKLRGPMRPLGLALRVEEGGLHYDGATAALALRALLGGGATLDLHSARHDLATGVTTVATDARDLRFPDDLAGLFGETTTAGLRAALPDRVVHATGLRVVHDARADRLDLAGGIVFAPADPENVAPDGMAPAGLVHLDRLTFWFPPHLPTTFDGALRAEGFAARLGLDVEDLRGPVAVAGRFDDDGVEVAATARGVSLELEGLPLDRADIDVTRRPEATSVDAGGGVAGGRFVARLRPGARNVGFAGEARIEGAELARIVGKDSEVSGRTDAVATFRSRSGADGLAGDLDVRVRDGSLGRIPVFSRILGLVGLGALNEGHVKGHFRGRTIEVRDAEIRGPVLSLHSGRGTVGFGGALNLTIDYSGDPLTIGPAKLLEVLTLGGLKLGRVHVTGTIRDPKVAWAPLTERGADSRR